ncbi:hypothetical protein F5144DRAFT_227583 [Chaetomium tenue]|uniref:Uncharacterized protein n=1 Tax=Chaetomium tenue TaxID=1854479 RepID=A0ACB7P876_9PEZI|nr:hypothetical protein F5144DRAFT_227583 [Chaetomium globosum]
MLPSSEPSHRSHFRTMDERAWLPRRLSCGEGRFAGCCRALRLSKEPSDAGPAFLDLGSQHRLTGSQSNIATNSCPELLYPVCTITRATTNPCGLLSATSPSRPPAPHRRLPSSIPRVQGWMAGERRGHCGLISGAHRPHPSAQANRSCRFRGDDVQHPRVKIVERNWPRREMLPCSLSTSALIVAQGLASTANAERRGKTQFVTFCNFRHDLALWQLVHAIQSHRRI